MNDQELTTPRDTALEAAGTSPPADTGPAKIIYVLYLVAIAVGLTALVGVVMAYVNKSDAPAWLQSHYRFQIRTFWIGALYNLVGLITVYIILGWFILLFTLVWLIIRCVKGLKALENNQPVADPASWMFG